MKAKIYGYARVSTLKQSIERQLRNIREKYPQAVIVTDEWTGTELDRPGWTKLYKKIKAGDVIVFDSVSRLSRNAEEGFLVYEELFNKGVELIFLKEPHIDTATYKKAIDGQIQLAINSGNAAADELISGISEAINKYLLSLAKEQIRLAFEQAEKEVEDLRQRTREGIETARQAGKQIGQKPGSKLAIKKSEPIKELIRKYSAEFDGKLGDEEVMLILKGKTVEYETGKLEVAKDENGNPIIDENGHTKRVPAVRRVKAGLARNTYYKYKRELKAET